MPYHKIYVGNTLNVLKKLPDESVDCIVTSPPYWGLRNYGEETNVVWGGDPDCEHNFEVIETKRPNASGGKTEYAKEKLAIKGTENYKEFVDYHNRVTTSAFCSKCGAWYGQLGLEPTLDMYIKHLLLITKELKRVLKKTGVMFWNHGDSYFGGHPGGSIHGKITGERYKDKDVIPQQKEGRPQGSSEYRIKEKCLVMQNYRLILRMIDEQGWILRNVIIWHKLNHMPSSVRDRFTNAYEPVFMLTKSKHYYFDLDVVREPAITGNGAFQGFRNGKRFGFLGMGLDKLPSTFGQELKNHPLGKNPGDIWQVPYAVQLRTKEFVETRNLHDINKLANWLKEWKKQASVTIEKIEERMDSQAPHHWFSAESYPTKEEWLKFKKLFGIDKTPFDDALTQVFLKPAEKQNHPLGKNPSDLWSLSTEPFKDAHFAVFPEKLVNPMIKAGCPKQICKRCGKPKIPDVDVIRPENYDKLLKDVDVKRAGHILRSSNQTFNPDLRTLSSIYEASIKTKRIFKGYKSLCSCNAGWKSGVVLDPFAGSGTTNIVAEKLGRDSIGIELNPEYVEMIKRRFKPYINQMHLDGHITKLEIIKEGK